MYEHVQGHSAVDKTIAPEVRLAPSTFFFFVHFCIFWYQYIHLALLSA